MFIKKLIKGNKRLYRLVNYIRAELSEKHTDPQYVGKIKFQASLSDLAEIIKRYNLTSGIITDTGEYFLQTRDAIWLYYNFQDEKYSNGDGQNLEFKASYLPDPLEEFVLEYMKSGMCYFDIGANNGYYYSLKIAKKLNSCQIYSFEPDTKILYHLRKNIEFNRFGNIKIETLALTDKDGSAKLTADLGASGFLVADEMHDLDTIDVNCTSLDNYVTQNNIQGIDLIKVDIEGGEYNFLKGARVTLERFRPLLILELNEGLLKRSHTSFQEVKDFLDKTNYTIARVRSSNDVLAVPHYYANKIRNIKWLEL